jgi:Ca2+-binding RTX toxin-like protein
MCRGSADRTVPAMTRLINRREELVGRTGRPQPAPKHAPRHMRSAAAAIVSLLAAGALAAGASAEDRVLELVSTGPAGGNGAFDASFSDMSADGTRGFFVTEESLVGADTDGAYDVYERAGGDTTLVSTGPAGSTAVFDAFVDGVSADGSHVFFRTFEPMESADTDMQIDSYERAGGQTTLLSTGPAGGNGNLFPAFLMDASDDGTRAFFETDESLVSGDTDATRDVYERADGQTTLVSTGPAGGNGNAPALYMSESDDGTRVFFQTAESLVSGDTDATRDLYERADGQTTLVSTGPDGGNGPVHVQFTTPGLSSDGSRVFFETAESLVSADTDDSYDTYERAGGQTTLVSTGPAGGNGDFDAELAWRGVSADGTRAVFKTTESLVSADTDTTWDVYERSGGQTTLVSTGPAGGNAADPAVFADASEDGSRVFFETRESLVSADADDSYDIYERAGGQTTLVSTGPAGGNGFVDPVFEDASADGTRVFFETIESLVSADTDTALDVYERSGGQTTLISAAPAGGDGTVDAFLADASADGSRVYLETTGSLLSADTDDVQDAYLARIVAPGTTTPPAPAPGPGDAPAPALAPTPAGPHGPAPGACANLRTGTARADILTGGALGDRLRGLAGDDRLAGLAGDDCLIGGAGDDRLTGGGEHDRLTGGDGSDRVSGGPGKDRLAGGAGKDRLASGAGSDRLAGGAGRDRLVGGGGNDRINSHDGRAETVTCGRGNDRVVADRTDTLIGCERIRIR